MGGTNTKGTAPMTTEIRHYAYISTGKLSAMFTLWRGRDIVGDELTSMHVPDSYICNLAACGNDDEAESKARDYCERMGERMGVTVHFDGFHDEPQNKRDGKLSVFQTQALRAIEAGRFPFGKHRGTPITAAPDSYILFFADKHGDDDVVMSALAARCMGVAMEKDLIAKRDAARQLRAEQDAKSAHVGAVGERRVFKGEVVGAFFKRRYDNIPDCGYWITKVRCGDDLIVYMGNKLAEQGDVINFKATVKKHSEYQNIKTTSVNRPHLMKAEA